MAARQCRRKNAPDTATGIFCYIRWLNENENYGTLKFLALYEYSSECLLMYITRFWVMNTVREQKSALEALS